MIVLSKFQQPNAHSCCFRNAMLLPCSHIFAIQKKLSLDLFCSQLCERRWHTAYFQANGRVFALHTQNAANQFTHYEEGEMCPNLKVQTVPSTSQHSLSGPQKVKLGLQYGASLANLHADFGTAEFA